MHALIAWEERFNSRDVRVFDVGGNHPHIGDCKPSQNRLDTIYNYVIKDGNWWGADAPPQRGDTASAWANLVDATDRASFMKEVREEFPRETILSWPAIKLYAADHFPSHLGPGSFREFNPELIPRALTQWYDVDRTSPDRPKSLCIISPSRYGKTEWAVSTCRDYAYMNGEWDRGQISPEHRGCILDDIPTRYLLTSLKPLIGAQKRVTITGKYRGQDTIAWGFPCIILLNELPEEIAGNAWWMANVNVVILNEKLY